MDNIRSGPYLGIHTVKIFVKDQDRSLRFFVDQLGFDLAFDAKLQSGDRWVAVSPPDGSSVLTLVAPKPQSKEHNLIGRTTGVVLLTEDVLAKYNEWRQKGVRFHWAPRLRRVTYDSQLPPEGSSSTVPQGPEGRSAIWGGVFTRFKDVDGNTFELISFDAVTREVEVRRRAIAERAEAERRAAQELEIATRVQARLFPQELPTITTLEYAGICIQARQVGGDYYDFLDLGKGRFALVIGDIAGKGMAAALLMANLQASLRSLCAIILSEPERLLRSINRMFFQNSTEGAYATLFFAEYDNAERRMQYANCGHLCALIVRTDGKVDRLHSTATVVGLFDEWDCSTGECSLLEGDTFVLYTDGITESFNEAEEDFGERRLIEAVRRHRELPAEKVARAIVDEVQQFSFGEQHDDITLIVAKCRENTAQ